MPQQSRKYEPTKNRVIPNHNINNESRSSIIENSEATKKKKKKKCVFVKFKGLGCKGSSLPASAPAIIRSAAEWEAKRPENDGKKKKRNKNRRNQENVVVDIPDVCCAPPGIGIASDFAPRARTSIIAPRSYHRKQSREARRNEADFASSVRVSRTNNHQSAGEIIEMLMSQQQPMLSGRQDRYRGLRLDVDNMSYEELVDLGDKIGYVGTGLQEEEILRCLRKSKHFNFDSTALLVAYQKDWKCSICQEKCKRDDDIGTLRCGHHHHIQCIKQWLMHKNTCPVCKSAVMPDMPDT